MIQTATVNLTRDQLADTLGALLEEMDFNNRISARISRGAFDPDMEEAVKNRMKRLSGAYGALNAALSKLEHETT